MHGRLDAPTTRSRSWGDPRRCADAATEERQRAARALLERQVLLAGDPSSRSRAATARSPRRDLRDHLGYSLPVSPTRPAYPSASRSRARPLSLAPRNQTERASRRRAPRLGAAWLPAGLPDRRGARAAALWTQVPLGAIAEAVAQAGALARLELDWKLAADRTRARRTRLSSSRARRAELRSGARGRAVTATNEAFYDVTAGASPAARADPVRRRAVPWPGGPRAGPSATVASGGRAACAPSARSCAGRGPGRSTSRTSTSRTAVLRLPARRAERIAAEISG